MKILTWAAVAVTGLFVIMNLGAAAAGDVDAAYRGVGVVLGIIGAVAAIGLATNQPWGRAAVIGVGALNLIGSIVALIDDQEGAVIGIVLGGLGVVLGMLAPNDSRRIVQA